MLYRVNQKGVYTLNYFNLFGKMSSSQLIVKKHCKFEHTLPVLCTVNGAQKCSILKRMDKSSYPKLYPACGGLVKEKNLVKNGANWTNRRH